MAKKKIESVEEEVKKIVRNDSDNDDWKKIIQAYDEYVVEDEDFVKTVGLTACENIFNDFSINFSGKEEGKDGYKMVILIFVKTIEQIIATLISKRTTMSSYEINIADRLVIGYTNSTDNPDDEKLGNFMIYLQDLGHYIAPNDEIRSGGSCREYITQWNNENMVKQPTVLESIASSTRKVLYDQLNIRLVSNEFVFPIFVTVYETLVHILKITRGEIGEEDLQVNFCNCFEIRALLQDNGTDKIIIKPSIEMKMGLKSDAIGTAIYE